MKLLATTFLFMLLSCAVCAQADEKPIRVSGVVSLEVFPGPPNYESIKDGDKPEEAWILTTAKNERFQLVVVEGVEKKFATLRRFLGKKVAITGVVWSANTGHHRTPLLITLASIQEESALGSGNPPKKEEKSLEERLRALEDYVAEGTPPETPEATSVGLARRALQEVSNRIPKALKKETRVRFVTEGMAIVSVSYVLPGVAAPRTQEIQFFYRDQLWTLFWIPSRDSSAKRG